MNTFYFNDRTERIETVQPANSHTVIKTEKDYDTFVEDYENAREQGNSIIDAIECARSLNKNGGTKMTEKGEKLTSELNNIYTDLDTFGKNLYTSFNDIDEEDRKVIQKILGYITETSEKYYTRLNY